MLAEPSPEELSDLGKLRTFVQSRICDHNQLEVGAFRMTERVLTRSGRPCGIFFCVHGPRSVKFTAIWETERNTILFYGSGGERLMRTQLRVAPDLAARSA
jgi:hypothetical protein